MELTLTECRRAPKRMRTDSPTTSPAAVRDHKFYHKSGDCILRAGNTLFKVHKFMMARDSPIFASLFSLPQGGLAVEGLSDDLPVCLEGDTADDIQSLLKYIYAPAHDAQIPDIPVTELDNILAVARLADKYDMKRWQSWALDVILHLLTRDSTSLSTIQYMEIYDLSYTLLDERVRNKTAMTWLDMIKRGALPISDALSAAESKGARTFLTLLYEHQLACFPISTSSTLQPVTIDLCGLSNIHIQRLLVGYWSLTESWAQLRGGVIPLTCPATCFLERHTGLCLPVFKTIWERAVTEVERLPITATTKRIESLISILRSPTSYIFVGGMDIPWGGEPCIYVPSDLPDDPLGKLLAGMPKSLEGHFFGEAFLSSQSQLSSRIRLISASEFSGNT
ncbi:hypothetical protein B0H11DRAFT_1902445 [Mycena galericulata]|nr:hypothetical protein B0H11DRAFT_1902445 [Mycena galericulata]